jgi:AraC-like ligand binding domain
MYRSLGFAVLTTLTFASAAYAEEVGGGQIFSPAETSALAAKGASVPLVTKGATITMARRDKTGEIEIHEKAADFMIGQEGSARLTLGGTVTGARQTAPGEWRGGVVTGGVTRDLAPGDMVYIPPGVPHLFTLKDGEHWRYTNAKIPVDAPAGAAPAPR